MTFFLRIQDPTPLRKDILTSAKDVILVQYKAEKVHRLRKKRQRHKEDVNELLSSLQKRATKLVKKLEDKDLDVDVNIQQVSFNDKEDSNSPSKKPENLDETDRLEYTLQRIEKTLSNLD